MVRVLEWLRGMWIALRCHHHFVLYETERGGLALYCEHCGLPFHAEAFR